ncbi:MAG: class II aldolase/adducin family protein [Candidatus Limivicinus sp.]|jgi:L-ribulose-5-phosphate 4-epimerase
MDISDMKEAVCSMAKQSYSEKLFAGTSGNLSVFDRESGIMVITPTSVPYELITPGDMVAMRTDGSIVDGRLSPSSEWRMHAEIYNGKSGVGALVHTHSPFATAFAAAHRNIPAALIEMVHFLGGDVPLAKFAVPGTADVGLEALKALKDRNACLLANHGVLTVGRDLSEAHIRAVYVEDAAKICILAKGAGGIHSLSDEAIAAMKG